MSLADGGHVYVTQPIYENAEGWLHEWQGGALKWVNHGDFMVKGVDDPMTIYEVVDTTIQRAQPPKKGQKASAGSATPASPQQACASCGVEYASRLSLSGACESCGAPLCMNCSRIKSITRCRDHQ